MLKIYFVSCKFRVRDEKQQHLTVFLGCFLLNVCIVTFYLKTLLFWPKYFRNFGQKKECAKNKPLLCCIFFIVNTFNPYLPHGLGFLCSLRGSNLIFHAHCLLSEKLMAVLIVTGEGRAETIADNNSKTIQYIFSPRGII